MAMFRCKRHGLKGGVAICRHVSTALLDNKGIHFTPIDGGMLMGRFWLCDECKAEWDTIGHSEEEIDPFLEKIMPVCGECFKEWQRLIT